MKNTMPQTNVFVSGIGMVGLTIEKDEETGTYQMFSTTPENETKSYAKWCFKMSPAKHFYQGEDGNTATELVDKLKSDYKKADFHSLDPYFDKLITKVIQYEGMTIDYTEKTSTTLLGLDIFIRDTKTDYHLDAPFYQYVRVYDQQTDELLLTLERTDRQVPKGILNIKVTEKGQHAFLSTDDSVDTIKNYLQEVTGIRRIYLDPDHKDISKDEIEHILNLTEQTNV